MGKPSHIVFTIVDSYFIQSGYRRASSTWYHLGDDLIRVVNLRRSSFSARYYLNAALSLRALDEQERPKEHQCPIRARLESLAPHSAGKMITDVLDLDLPMPDSKRQEAVVALLRAYILPFFANWSSAEQIRENLREGRGSGLLVTARLKEHLGVPIEPA